MEFYIDKEELNKAIGTAGRFVPLKSTMPIVECLLFTAENGEVRLTANDTELSIEAWLTDAEVKEDGKIAVNAKTLSPIVSKLPNGKAHFKTDGDTVKLTCGKSKFNLSARDGEDFPAIKDVSKDSKITLNQMDLRSIIAQTIFSVSPNDSNKIMTGEHLKLSDKLTITALDGHRIAMRELDVSGELDAIIPNRTLTEIMKMPYDGDVDIYFDNDNIAFKYPQSTVVSRLIEGQYFDIDRMLTDTFSTEVTVDRKDLMSALERAMLLLSGQDHKPTVLKIDNELTIEMTTTTGSMSEVLSAEKTGESIVLGVNPRFLIEALRAVDEDTVTLRMNSSKNPIFIQGDGYRYIVLPVNLATQEG